MNEFDKYFKFKTRHLYLKNTILVRQISRQTKLPKIHKKIVLCCVYYYQPICEESQMGF